MNSDSTAPESPASRPVISPPRKRDHGMDALRTLAVLAMMASHTARLIVFEDRPLWARKVLLFEPVIPSLFLFLVGLSLAQSFGAARDRGIAPGAWYLRQWRRAALLWGISAVFFTAELGFRLPDALTASGILATIAYAIVFIGGLLALPGGRLLTAAAWIAGIALFLKLDAGGHRVFLVNIGNSPLLPLWLFAFAGALWGSTVGRTRRRFDSAREPEASLRWIQPTLAVLLGIAGAGVAAWLVTRYGAEALFTNPLGRSDAGRTVAAPVYGGTPLHLSYYNLRPVLAAACFGLHLAALVLLGILLGKMGEGPARFLFALGRHALGAYILHLALLAALVVTMGQRPLKQGWQVAAVWATVALISWIWAIYREQRRAKRLKTADSGETL